LQVEIDCRQRGGRSKVAAVRASFAIRCASTGKGGKFRTGAAEILSAMMARGSKRCSIRSKIRWIMGNPCPGEDAGRRPRCTTTRENEKVSNRAAKRICPRPRRGEERKGGHLSSRGGGGERHAAIKEQQSLKK